MRSVIVLASIFIAIALLGPLLAPHDPVAINIPSL